MPPIQLFVEAPLYNIGSRGDLTPILPTWEFNSDLMAYELTPIRLTLNKDEAKKGFLGLKFGNNYISAKKTIERDSQGNVTKGYIETYTLPTPDYNTYDIILSEQYELKKIVQDPELQLEPVGQYWAYDKDKRPCLVFAKP